MFYFNIYNFYIIKTELSENIMSVSNRIYVLIDNHAIRVQPSFLILFFFIVQTMNWSYNL